MSVNRADQRRLLERQSDLPGNLAKVRVVAELASLLEGSSQTLSVLDVGCAGPTPFNQWRPLFAAYRFSPVISRAADEKPFSRSSPGSGEKGFGCSNHTFAVLSDPFRPRPEELGVASSDENDRGEDKAQRARRHAVRRVVSDAGNDLFDDSKARSFEKISNGRQSELVVVRRGAIGLPSEEPLPRHPNERISRSYANVGYKDTVVLQNLLELSE